MGLQWVRDGPVQGEWDGLLNRQEEWCSPAGGQVGTGALDHPPQKGNSGQDQGSACTACSTASCRTQHCWVRVSLGELLPPAPAHSPACPQRVLPRTASSWPLEPAQLWEAETSLAVGKPQPSNAPIPPPEPSNSCSRKPGKS